MLRHDRVQGPGLVQIGLDRRPGADRLLRKARRPYTMDMREPRGKRLQPHARHSRGAGHGRVVATQMLLLAPEWTSPWQTGQPEAGSGRQVPAKESWWSAGRGRRGTCRSTRRGRDRERTPSLVCRRVVHVCATMTGCPEPTAEPDCPKGGNGCSRDGSAQWCARDERWDVLGSLHYFFRLAGT